MSNKKIKLIDKIQKVLIEIECNGISQRSMSKSTGLTRYKISQFIKRKPGTDMATLDLNDILALVKFIKNCKCSADVLKTLDEDSKVLLSVFDGISESELSKKPSVEVSDEVLEDFDNVLILIMASGSATLEDIEANILPHNRYKIDQLIEIEIISIIDGYVRIKNAEFVTLPIRILHLHLPHLIKSFYSPARVGDGTNLIRFSHGSVSLEGQKEIRKISNEMVNSVDKVICEKPGDKSVFYSVVFDKFNGG